MKQVVLFLSNKHDKCTIKQFNRLYNQLKLNKDVDLVFLYNTDKSEINLVTNKYNYYIFSNNDLLELDYKSIESNKILPIDTHFPLLKYFLDNSNYDYYWIIGDDVRYTDDFNNLILKCDKCNSDLLTSYIRDYNDEPTWYWWFRDNNLNMPIHDLLASFNPLYRISNKGLNLIHNKLSQQIYGHHELILPTLISNNNLILKDFNEVIPNIYNGNTYSYKKLDSIEYHKDMLYHPIKTKNK